MKTKNLTFMEAYKQLKNGNLKPIHSLTANSTRNWLDAYKGFTCVEIEATDWEIVEPKPVPLYGLRFTSTESIGSNKYHEEDVKEAIKRLLLETCDEIVLVTKNSLGYSHEETLRAAEQSKKCQNLIKRKAEEIFGKELLGDE